MLNNCIKNLLNLKGLNVKSVKNFKNSVQIHTELPKSELKYFKRTRFLLLSSRSKIKKDYYNELENMLINYSENLRTVYREKECLLYIIHSKDPFEVKKNLFAE